MRIARLFAGKEPPAADGGRYGSGNRNYSSYFVASEGGIPGYFSYECASTGLICLRVKKNEILPRTLLILKRRKSVFNGDFR
jgi:hypothetical protein